MNWRLSHACGLIGAALFLLIPSFMSAMSAAGSTDRFPEGEDRFHFHASWRENDAPPSPLEAHAVVLAGINDAVALAFANNADMEMAAARIQESRAMVMEARSAFQPSLQLYTEYTHADAPSVHAFKRLDQRRLPLMDFDFNDPGTFQNFESGMAARLNLFKGGSDVLRERMARKGLEIRELDRDAVRNELTASVIGAYFDVLAARDHVEIVEQSIKTVESQLHTVRVFYEGGSALKSELLSVEVRLAQTREEHIRAVNRHRLALAALKHILGVQGRPHLELLDDSWTPPVVPSDIEEAVEMALTRRPELLKVRQEAVSARMGVAMERAAYLPTVDLHARAYMADENMRYDADRGNWTVGVLMTWDIFTGLSTRARVDRARARLARIEAMDRKIVQAVEFDVRQAYYGYEEARSRLDVSRRARAQAEEAFRLVRIEYEKGSADIVRYLDVELTRNALRVAETAALYDFKRSGAQVAASLGYFSI